MADVLGHGDVITRRFIGWNRKNRGGAALVLRAVTYAVVREWSSDAAVAEFMNAAELS